MKFTAVFIALALTAVSAFADKHDEKHEMPKPKLSKAFEGMKALVGTWTGRTEMHGKEMDATVTYKLTSNNTVLVETINPGSEMEMITVYANRGESVNATHYCALGNQPEMKLKKFDDHSFAFEMQGTRGISDKNEMHMHSVKLTVDGNTLTQEWTNHDKNKAAGTHVFKLSKKI